MISIPDMCVFNGRQERRKREIVTCQMFFLTRKGKKMRRDVNTHIMNGGTHEEEYTI